MRDDEGFELQDAVRRHEGQIRTLRDRVSLLEKMVNEMAEGYDALRSTSASPEKP